MVAPLYMVAPRAELQAGGHYTMYANSLSLRCSGTKFAYCLAVCSLSAGISQGLHTLCSAHLPAILRGEGYVVARCGRMLCVVVYIFSILHGKGVCCGSLGSFAVCSVVVLILYSVQQEFCCGSPWLSGLLQTVPFVKLLEYLCGEIYQNISKSHMT